MKKILAVLLATSSVAVFADTFQDFNNNLYVGYGLVAPTYKDAQNIDQWGIGGTIQTKNNIWVSANASMGQTTSGSVGNNTGGQVGFKAGYALQFFGDEAHGFQLIPYVSFDVQQGTQSVDSNEVAIPVSGNIYTYGIGIQPEYRLMDSLKLALGVGITGNQVNVNGNSQQNFNYAITPQVQYDISKTVMLGVGYTYANAFNSSNSATGVGGTNTVTAKVGYLF